MPIANLLNLSFPYIKLLINDSLCISKIKIYQYLNLWIQPIWARSLNQIHPVGCILFVIYFHVVSMFASGSGVNLLLITPEKAIKLVGNDFFRHHLRDKNTWVWSHVYFILYFWLKTCYNSPLSVKYSFRWWVFTFRFRCCYSQPFFK